jgi:hypothetical protein
MVCPNCGKELSDNTKFCTNCGAQIVFNPNNAQRQKFVWKEKFTYIAIAAVIVVAAVVGCVIRFSGNLTSDKSGGQSDIIVKETEKPTQESEVTEEEATENDMTENDMAEDDMDEDDGTAVKDEAEPLLPDASMGHVTGAYASSVLVEDKYNLVHGAENVLDGDASTAWSEAATGNGIGEWLTITLDQKCVISGISIMNGYQKSEKLYKKNSRPSDLEVEFSDGTTELIHINDQMGWETITFSQTHVADEISFTIQGVYEGNTYDDTLITDIQIF